MFRSTKRSFQNPLLILQNQKQSSVASSLGYDELPFPSRSPIQVKELSLESVVDCKTLEEILEIMENSSYHSEDTAIAVRIDVVSMTTRLNCRRPLCSAGCGSYGTISIIGTFI